MTKGHRRATYSRSLRHHPYDISIKLQPADARKIAPLRPDSSQSFFYALTAVSYPVTKRSLTKSSVFRSWFIAAVCRESKNQWEILIYIRHIHQSESWISQGRSHQRGRRWTVCIAIITRTLLEEGPKRNIWTMQWLIVAQTTTMARVISNYRRECK